MADYYPVEHFQKQYYRPDVVNLTLKLSDPNLALQVANHNRLISESARMGPELPPQVVVVTPKEGKQRTHSRKLKVTAVATSSAAPIEELKITLNGQVVNQLIGTTKGSPLRRIEEVEVELLPGKNHLTFTAATTKSSSLTEERVVIYHEPSTAVQNADKPNLAVLAVGIAHYQDLGLRLEYADNDARDIAQLFRSQEGKAFSRVSTKVLDGSTPVNREELIRGLNWLKEAVPGKNGIRLVFLSGHGALDSGGDYYFLGQGQRPGVNFEEKSLSWQVLLKMLAGEETTAILMLDTCHSAAATGPLKTSNVDIADQLRRYSPSNLITFSSSSNFQVSIEGEGNGLFTAAILEGLGDLQADGYFSSEKDGRIEAVELGSYVTVTVSKRTQGRQRPNFALPAGLDVLQLFRSVP
jgi:hypothetical protein